MGGYYLGLYLCSGRGGEVADDLEVDPALWVRNVQSLDELIRVFKTMYIGDFSCKNSCALDATIYLRRKQNLLTLQLV